MIVQRVEKVIITSKNPYFKMLDDFCFKAKNLYNHGNFVIRESFCNKENPKYITYYDLDKIVRNDIEFPDYRNMPTAQSSQQTLKLLDQNWKSFFKSIKDWKVHKDRYKNKPKIPKYLKKDGRFILILTNQEVKLKDDNLLHFPKTFHGFTMKPNFVNRSNFKSFQQVRFIPKNKQIIIELVYNIEISELKEDNQRYLSIDIGIDNLATITNNFNEVPIILNGKGLKSINQYYNKKLSYYKSISKLINNKDWTNRQNKLTIKRNNKVTNYLHKASRILIDYAFKNNVSVIIIGNNKEWKQNVGLGKRNNQNFVQIPFNTFIQQIQYKAEEVGIKVILVEESYTSGTSFLDNELPVKESYNKNRRIHRGLFKSNNGTLINADVNGSFQILKKVFLNAYANGIEDLVFNPVKVSIKF